VHVINGSGKETITLNGGGNGEIKLFDSDGNKMITLDGGSGNIKVSGADCAEMFGVAQGLRVEAGTVLVLDGDGGVQPCDQAYDRRVAGVASGAGEHRPSVILNSRSAGGVAVALVGRVFGKVDATAAPIEVGDLLTTSPAAGHAMKACDTERIAGAVLGKAMAALASGQGLIPILVLLGYVLRPPLAQDRLEQHPGGLVRITLQRAYSDGTLAVDMDPLSLLCRLATSVPPPRFHTVLYAGVLAPASPWRPGSKSTGGFDTRS
jgi:hypothetical protein